jgi:hypothetical protein
VCFSYNPVMPRNGRIDDTSILEAALVGLQHQRAEYTAKMDEIRRTLGIRAPRTSSVPATETAAPAKRTMSPAARKRIAAAQRKRWAAVRTAKEAPPKVTPKKQKLSAAGRKRIIAATKKRWAAVRAQKAAA